MFKKTILGLAVASLFATAPVLAEGSTGKVYQDAATGFFADSTLNGAVGVWMRSRTRGGVDANGNDKTKTPNLDHGSLYMTVNYNSGYAADVIGFDGNVYATFDMWNEASPDHEMNFWGVDNPYDTNPTASSGCVAAGGKWASGCNENGGQIQTAAIKLKGGDMFTAKMGWFQPSVPTGLGVNWSFAAGTYQGGEVGAKFGNLSLGAVYADSYRAPWFKDMYEFRESDNKTDAGDVYSLGARYDFGEIGLLDVAYTALTKGDRTHSHVKYKITTESGYYFSPQVYVVDDSDAFDSTAFQLAFLSAKSFGAYSVRAEGTYTSADTGDAKTVGNLVYRPTKIYGGSNGAYDIWWNNRSDFNHDGELAFFGEVKRDLTDMGATGLSVGVSGVYAFGAQAEGYDELVEYSGSAFLSYAIQNGALKGANFGMYATYYVNDSNADNWAGYTNGFQDESDLKVTFMMPFTIK